ncbi:hypothetical protein HJG53_04650 [Sphingomonas sp. ID1715]|uniref:hypothetical protein n=1 Tax=Sphingomonas sp. ID1715 TaxID=1656898 RepID=UPI00148866A8|nr:hypothetical protein [Sphingomonas sp. ID1715]NNM76195.1 hypothetical protein [Sphingomonas sp. ID1715]
MQRIRVGLTGLGAVLLIVAISAAIFESASHQPVNSTDPGLNRTEQVVANMVAANATEAPSEPLAEIGVTPGAPAASNSADSSK